MSHKVRGFSPFLQFSFFPYKTGLASNPKNAQHAFVFCTSLGKRCTWPQSYEKILNKTLIMSKKIIHNFIRMFYKICFAQHLLSKC